MKSGDAAGCWLLAAYSYGVRDRSSGISGAHNEWGRPLATGGWLLATELRVDSLGFALFNGG